MAKTTGSTTGATASGKGVTDPATAPRVDAVSATIIREEQIEGGGLDVVAFDQILSSTDDTTQKALDTLDDMFNNPPVGVIEHSLVFDVDGLIKIPSCVDFPAHSKCIVEFSYSMPTGARDAAYDPDNPWLDPHDPSSWPVPPIVFLNKGGSLKIYDEDNTKIKLQWSGDGVVDSRGHITNVLFDLQPFIADGNKHTIKYDLYYDGTDPKCKQTLDGTEVAPVTAIMKNIGAILFAKMEIGEKTKMSLYDLKILDEHGVPILHYDGVEDTNPLKAVDRSSSHNDGDLTNVVYAYFAGTIIGGLEGLKIILNPIDTVREFATDTNPSVLLGFGTWEAADGTSPAGYHRWKRTA